MPLTRATSTLVNTNIVDLSTGTNIDCSAGTYFTKTISSATTFTVSNVPSDRTYAFTLELQGNAAVTWWLGVVWPLSNAPVMVSSLVGLFMFVTDNGGVTWRGSYVTNYAVS